MKMTRTKSFLALALALAGGATAFAQSSNVPGPQDYDRFSSFVTERNIFDPNRVPAYTPGGRPFQPRRTQRYTPTFTLVGTMSYEKGMFAFFDGNSPELRQVLYQSDSNNIAGYTVAEITLAGVKLQSADKKQTVDLKIGDSMQQDGDTWQLAGRSDLASTPFPAGGEAPTAESPSSDAGATPAPSPALSANDTLKKLMERRKQLTQ